MDRLVVRMYNTGFGDCFLLTIPTPEGVRRMLIDCGTHPASTGKYRAERDVVPLLLADLTADGGARRIDVVVASHRHKDHVSGFANPAFNDVEVGEVWLPWTENPDDDVATGLRTRMGLAADAIGLAQLAFGGDHPAVAAAGALAANNLALRNEAAMEMLWHGFRGQPHHWYISAPTEPHTTPLLPGVTVHVLGPSRDEATIRDLEPPPNETFARLRADAAEMPQADVRPFDDGWSIPAGEFASYGAFENLRVSDRTQERIRRLAAEDLLAAAASLESSINGTSLMFVLDVGGILLFFPGDAQWGTWKAVLADERARDLLKRSSFYKIGHHGSHNATPQTFVDTVMSPATWAAVSVAGVKIWPLIPQEDLVTRIRARQVNLVQSDAPPAAGAIPGVTARDDVSVDFTFELPGSSGPRAAAPRTRRRRAAAGASP